MVNTGLLNGWDDPRLMTMAGLKRRGYSPLSINKFCEAVGITKNQGALIRYEKLENIVREEFDEKAHRVFAVVDPLKVVITNFDEVKHMTEWSAQNHPKRPELGTRPVFLGPVLYIEHSDFMEEPPKGYFRLSKGATVRLLRSLNIRCDDVVKDASGKV